MPPKGELKRFCKWGHDTFAANGRTIDNRCTACQSSMQWIADFQASPLYSDYYIMEQYHECPTADDIPTGMTTAHTIWGSGWPDDEYLVLLEHELNNLEKAARGEAYRMKQNAYKKKWYDKRKR